MLIVRHDYQCSSSTIVLLLYLQATIGVDGEEQWGAMKWQIDCLCKLKTAKWHQLVLYSVPHNAQYHYVNS